MQNQQDTSLHRSAEPLVSFIITYYNLPIPLLCQCVDSILSLSLRATEREIIIVDDGSEVSPMNGLMQYADDIIYVRQKNGGLSQARNLGIQMASGRYLQFVDADDHLLTAPYDHCLDILRLQGDADMVVFDFTSADKVSASFDAPTRISGTDYLRHHNIHGSACGYIVRRMVLGELRFTPGIYHEDEEFTPLLFIRAERIYITKAKAYFYNRRPQSITTATDQATTRQRLTDIKGVILRLYRLTDRLSPTDRVAVQRRVDQLTMDYIYQTIVQTRSRQQLDECIEQLQAEGLFPLPDRDYSRKYQWFRRMTNSSIGRTLLLNMLPLMKREK